MSKNNKIDNFYENIDNSNEATNADMNNYYVLLVIKEVIMTMTIKIMIIFINMIINDIIIIMITIIILLTITILIK